MAEPRPARVLENATRLVAELVQHGPATIAELAEAVELPRATAHRLVEALLAVDHVRTLDDGRVALSLRWLHLGDATARAHLGPACQEVLDALAADSGQTAFLSVPRGAAAVCLGWAQGQGIELLILRPGRQLPLYAGAAGRVTLAAQDDAWVDDFLGRAPFTALTSRTLTTGDELRADVAHTRQEGFSVSDEDVTPGIGAVGVPVLDDHGTFIGSLSLAGAAQDIRDHLDAHLALLRREAPRVHLT